tara:strand:+ start:4208 stop:4513 length:306 start_codon:yes stop_codon:yes gene_type:complete
MPNRCYEPRSAGKVPVQYVFEGNHEKLVTGATYTLKEISIIIGVNDKTMHSRMKGKFILTDKEVRPKQDMFGGNNPARPGLYDRLEKPDMKLSDKWLRMKL